MEQKNPHPEMPSLLSRTGDGYCIFKKSNTKGDRIPAALFKNTGTGISFFIAGQR
jgi:hypothetical protein